MTREEAVQFLRSCRDTHQLWLDHFTRYPEDERSYSCCVGDKAHHEGIVKRYDAVIELLKGS